MTLLDAPAVTILVVDHDKEHSRVLRASLEQHAFRVCTEHAAQAALSQVASLHPDIVLVALNLPEIDTGELCATLKRSVEPSFLPVVLVAEPTRYKQAMDAASSADGVLFRPVRISELLLQITSLLRIRRQYDDLWAKNQGLTAELAKRNRELEKAFKESQEASLLKDSIVKNVSHELRTPLLQIKSSVAMLAEDARAASPNGASVLADMATAATAKLESVVQNITQLAATINVKLETFRLSDAVNLAVRQTGRQWLSSGAVDRIKYAVHDAPLIIGDRSGVAQVLQQLIDNAIKFSPKGGNVDITAALEGDMLRIAVSDHGIGIADDQLERIFQAFYQVDSSSTRRYGGAGVGLAIVKLLLDKMDTNIYVQSELGIGSTFSFTLPIAKGDELSMN